MKYIKNMNRWFDETFIPSLYEKVRQNGLKSGKITITERQCDICTREMQRIETGYASHPHVRFEYNWNGRRITLFIFRGKYGEYGAMNFGYTDEEKQENSKRLMLDGARRSNATYKRHRERFEEDIKHWKQILEDATEDNDEWMIELSKAYIEGL